MGSKSTFPGLLHPPGHLTGFTAKAPEKVCPHCTTNGAARVLRVHQPLQWLIASGKLVTATPARPAGIAGIHSNAVAIGQRYASAPSGPPWLLLSRRKNT